MSLERLNYLKRIVTVSMIGHLAPDEQADLTELINAEIKRIESRRKVPLVPCRICRKKPKLWKNNVRNEYFYRCDCIVSCCGKTDRAARIAWNEAQKGGEQ